MSRLDIYRSLLMGITNAAFVGLLACPLFSQHTPFGVRRIEPFETEKEALGHNKSEAMPLLSEAQAAAQIRKKMQNREEEELKNSLSLFFLHYPNSVQAEALKKEAADFFFRTQNYRQVVFLLEDLNKTRRVMRPEDEKLRFQFVYSLTKIERYREAIQVAREMQQHCQTHCPDFAYYLGVSYYKLQQYDLVAEVMKQAKEKPNYVQSANDLILDSHLKAKNEEQLVETLISFIEQKEVFDKKHYYIAANSLYNKNKWTQAADFYQRYYERLHQTDPQRREVAFMIGNCLLQDAQKEQAQGYLQQVVQEQVQDSLTQVAYYHLALIYQQEGQKEAALDMYKGAYHIRLENQETSRICQEKALYHIISLYQLLGNYAQVKQGADEYFQLFPTGFYWTNIKKAWYEAFFKEDEVLALKSLQREVVAQPELQQLLQQYLTLLGDKAFNQGFYKKALGYYELLEREPLKEPSRSELYFKMGVSYFLQNLQDRGAEIEKSLYYFNKITLPYYRDYSRYYLGLAAFNAKNYQAAIGHLSACVGSTEFDDKLYIKAEAELLLADSYTATVRQSEDFAFEQAELHYNQVIDQTANTSTNEGQYLQAQAYYHWGRLLYFVQKDEQALRNYLYVAQNFNKTPFGFDALLDYVRCCKDLGVGQPQDKIQLIEAIQFATNFINTNSRHPRILELVFLRLEAYFVINESKYDNLACEDVRYILERAQPSDKLYKDAFNYGQQLENGDINCTALDALPTLKEEARTEEKALSMAEEASYLSDYERILALYSVSTSDFVLKARNFLDYHQKQDEASLHLHLLVAQVLFHNGNFQTANAHWAKAEAASEQVSDKLSSLKNYVAGQAAFHKGFFKDAFDHHQAYMASLNIGGAVVEQDAYLQSLYFMILLCNKMKDRTAMLQYIEELESRVGSNSPAVALYKSWYKMRFEDIYGSDFVQETEAILNNAPDSPHLADLYDVAFEMLDYKGFDEQVARNATSKKTSLNRNLRITALLWLYKVRFKQGNQEDSAEKYLKLLKEEELSEREKEWIGEVK
ncbi:tetratricopeptide repeat protein [Hugenholtzia roseola]|uniref:tetratricopeptide repeat protein n=1 Tax=Hugenholtzia roseola TaxID=1002 RepID=UPI000425D24E|nr:hypothetical protein [Hugenholtzia roseola]